MKFGKNPELNYSTDTERSEETDDDEGTPDDRGYHMLKDLPPEDQRNLSHLNSKLKLKDRRLPNEPNEPKRLNYVTGNDNNKDLITVFTAMSVFGALGSFVFRLLVS